MRSQICRKSEADPGGELSRRPYYLDLVAVLAYMPARLVVSKTSPGDAFNVRPLSA
jgi:hypothetical protein